MTVTPRSTIQTTADSTVTTNGTRAITGAILNQLLDLIIASGTIPYYREVTAAGNITVGADDSIIGVNKTSGAATDVALGLSSARNGHPVTIKDVKGDAATNNITFTFAGGETCDGLSSSSFTINVNYGSRTFYPRTGGWFTLA